MYRYNSISSWILEKEKTDTDRIALVSGEKEISFAQVAQNIRKTACRLTAEGIGRGDCILYLLRSSPEFFYTTLAVGLIGAVAVGAAYRSVAETVHAIIDEVKPRLVVTDRENEARLRQIVSEDIKVITGEELLNIEPAEKMLAHIEESRRSITLEDDFMVLYTSGTTSKPKGAVLTHKNVLAVTQMIIDHCCKGGLHESDIFPHCFPVNHVSGAVGCGMAPLAVGAKMILYPDFNPATILEACEKFRVTVMCGVPAMWSAIINFSKTRKFDLSSVRSVMSVAAPLPTAMVKDINDLFGYCENPLGMTETSSLCTYCPVDMDEEKCATTLGHIMPEMKVKIVKADGTVAKPGEIGQLCYKGDSVIKRYISQPLPEDDEGYFLGGDLAYQDEDGILHICGRNDDMFTVCGYNVFPDEIEDVLRSFPGVRGAVVVPKTHRSMGSICHACLIADEGVKARQVRKFAEEHLIYYKVPRSYSFVDSFPTNALGKVDRKKLMAILREKHTI